MCMKTSHFDLRLDMYLIASLTLLHLLVGRGRMLMRTDYATTM
jgi:hypothetical protein